MTQRKAWTMMALVALSSGLLLGARVPRETSEKASEKEIFATGKVGFSLELKGELNPYSVLGIYVMPLEDVEMKVILGEEGRDFVVQTKGGTVTRLDQDRWLWVAPETPGLYPIEIHEITRDEKMTLNAFVLVPYAGQEELNRYRIGGYRSQPLRGDPAYNRPRGFIEITAKNMDTRVSPHFKLSQFLCKQQSGYPKYLILRERLLLKLEAILERVNDKGWHTNTLYVMSAFRTPFYNAAIGNSTTYSRHSYGDASDIFVDGDGNALMDDLNKDGTVDLKDGVLLEDLIEDLTEEENYRVFAGGLHLYPATASHGPMVHVDTRGKNVRW